MTPSNPMSRIILGRKSPKSVCFRGTINRKPLRRTLTRNLGVNNLHLKRVELPNLVMSRAIVRQRSKLPILTHTSKAMLLSAVTLVAIVMGVIVPNKTIVLNR